MGKKILKRPDLNPQQEMFCREYARTLNATQSYIKVYNAETKVAEASSCRLLGHDKVSQRIRQLLEERVNRVEEDGDEFLRQLKYSSLFDPKEVFDFDGTKATFKSFDEMPLEARRMITSVKVRNYNPREGDPYTEIEVKFVAKEKMKELWGRHRGVFNDKLNVTQTIKLEDLIAESNPGGDSE